MNIGLTQRQFEVTTKGYQYPMQALWLQNKTRIQNCELHKINIGNDFNSPTVLQVVGYQMFLSTILTVLTRHKQCLQTKFLLKIDVVKDG